MGKTGWYPLENCFVNYECVRRTRVYVCVCVCGVCVCVCGVCVRCVWCVCVCVCKTINYDIHTYVSASPLCFVFKMEN